MSVKNYFYFWIYTIIFNIACFNVLGGHIEDPQTKVNLFYIVQAILTFFLVIMAVKENRILQQILLNTFCVLVIFFGSVGIISAIGLPMKYGETMGITGIIAFIYYNKKIHKILKF